MFELLVGILASLVFACHLMCVNVATMMPLACLGFGFRPNRADRAINGIGRRLARLCWLTLLVGMVLGFILAGLRWWHGGSTFFDALARIPLGRITWGVAELAFYFLCMVPVAVRWERIRQRKILFGLLAILAATNLMYHFPPLFVVIGVLGESKGIAAGALDLSAFRQLMLDPGVLSRVTHHLMAAVATTGVLVMIVSLRAASWYEDDADVADHEAAIRMVRRGAGWALGASLLQIPVGVWVLLTLAEPMRQAVLGSDTVTTVLFCTSIVAALGLLHHLASVAMGEIDRRTVHRAAGLLMVVVVLMTATLRG